MSTVLTEVLLLAGNAYFWHTALGGGSFVDEHCGFLMQLNIYHACIYSTNVAFDHITSLHYLATPLWRLWRLRRRRRLRGTESGVRSEGWTPQYCRRTPSIKQEVLGDSVSARRLLLAGLRLQYAGEDVISPAVNSGDLCAHSQASPTWPSLHLTHQGLRWAPRLLIDNRTSRILGLHWIERSKRGQDFTTTTTIWNQTV